jgi:hypothetical protein
VDGIGRGLIKGTFLELALRDEEIRERPLSGLSPSLDANRTLPKYK